MFHYLQSEPKTITSSSLSQSKGRSACSNKHFNYFLCCAISQNCISLLFSSLFYISTTQCVRAPSGSKSFLLSHALIINLHHWNNFTIQFFCLTHTRLSRPFTVSRSRAALFVACCFTLFATKCTQLNAIVRRSSLLVTSWRVCVAGTRKSPRSTPTRSGQLTCTSLPIFDVYSSPNIAILSVQLAKLELKLSPKKKSAICNENKNEI